ncbi:hypothetical protein [Actinoallomurus sp. CA-150999]|uniref:hypothetical protein n=1 Tax=Actinoallomurus sp. CA-150999 TaxID=3239887 RepID=UPI003D93D657
MRAELRASLEELMRDYSRQVERLKDLRRALDEGDSTATRRDGLAKITTPSMPERWTAALRDAGMTTDLQAMAKNYAQAERPRAIHGHASTMRV